MKNIKQHIIQLPKADVHNHLHLAGSQKRFAEHYPHINIDFPKNYAGISGMIDFIYNTLNKVMLTRDDVIAFMDIAIKSAIDDHVILLEASIDIGLVRYFNNSIENLIETVVQLKDKYKSQINFKPDIGINKDLDLERVYSNGEKCIKSGVFYGIDLYGQEAGKDLRPFAKLYEMANDFGLKTKVHIGEFSDHISIENTILLLKPDEIQHGIRAVDSKKTIDLILKHNIRLNICPSSNILLGAVDKLEDHPVRTLYDYGINLTINTDDLILFNVSITDEFINLLEVNLFTLEELDEIRTNAFI